jgi:hypothetical protein
MLFNFKLVTAETFKMFKSTYSTTFQAFEFDLIKPDLTELSMALLRTY